MARKKKNIIQDFIDEPLDEELHVHVGSAVIVKNGTPNIEHVPLLLRDLVLEWLPWGNGLICQRGVAKAMHYWFGYRESFQDSRSVVYEPDFPDFNGHPRGFQAEVAQLAIETEEGLIELPTGSGKTVLALLIASMLKQRTLFVTTRTTLLHQTAKSVKHFLGFEPGLIGDGQVSEGMMTIGLFQSIANRIQQIKDNYGLLIIDEVHHAAADTLLEICAAVSAKYRFGMSATVRRNDKRNEILELILGPKIISTSALSIASHLSFPTIHFVYTDIKFYAEDWPDLLTKITRHKERNTLITNMAMEKAQENERILILTKRIEHAKLLVAELESLKKNSRFPKKPHIYEITGAITRKFQFIRIQSFKDYGGIMIGTEELCGEGFDLPTLDFMIVAMPAAEIRGHQRVGRLMRLFKSEQGKAVYDFVDEGPICRNLAAKRETEYAEMGLEIGEGIYASEPEGGSDENSTEK